MSTSLSSIPTTRCQCLNLRPQAEGEAGIAARHHGIPGFEQGKLARASILQVGCGGLGGNIGHALVRKGIGTLFLCDGDDVELSNLNRQLFSQDDLYKNKAECLARNLSRSGFCGTELVGFACTFEELLLLGAVPRVDVLSVGVDDDGCRVAVQQYCLEQNLPAVFTAVSADADNGYTFVFEPGKACLGCVLPDLWKSAREGRKPCPGVPACLDVLLVVSALAVYAIDTLVMARHRTWNFRRVFLSGEAQDSVWNIPRRQNCPVCGERSG